MSKRNRRGDDELGDAPPDEAAAAPAEVVRDSDGVATPPPPDAGPPAGDPVPAAGDGIAAADAELARLRAENAALKAKYEPPAPAPADGRPLSKFTVAYPGTHLPATEVEAADEAAAVQAFQAKLGVHSLPTAPVVTPAE